MAMSLGPLEIDVSLDCKDPAEVEDMIQQLWEEAQKLTSGSDARVLLHMIIGFMHGRLEETS